MTRKLDSISVVVCVHDERRWHAIGRCIASLLSQTHPVEQVIVVVDHNDDLLTRVTDAHEGVVAVANRQDRGLSGARNTGVELATGTLVAFLDDDAAAAPDWIERLATACLDPAVLGAGGSSFPRWLERSPSWFPEEFLWVVGCTYRGLPTQAAPVRNIYGGCFCIRRQELLELGGFLAEFGRVGTKLMCNEETELCIRATRRWPDRHFLFEPAAVIEHEVPGPRATWSYFRRRCFAEGVSKAHLARVVGSAAGLSSERAHAVRTLPAGIAREVAGGLTRREPVAFVRAAAIFAGLAITSSGYAFERLRRAEAR